MLNANQVPSLFYIAGIVANGAQIRRLIDPFCRAFITENIKSINLIWKKTHLISTSPTLGFETVSDLKVSSETTLSGKTDANILIPRLTIQQINCQFVPCLFLQQHFSLFFRFVSSVPLLMSLRQQSVGPFCAENVSNNSSNAFFYVSTHSKKPGLTKEVENHQCDTSSERLQVL